MIRSAGIEPHIIEYLKTPLQHQELAGIIREAGLTVRQAMRENEAIYVSLGLADPDLDDARLIDAILANPSLLNRPFVKTGMGTRLCRPVELVQEILPREGSD